MSITGGLGGRPTGRSALHQQGLMEGRSPHDGGFRHVPPAYDPIDDPRYEDGGLSVSTMNFETVRDRRAAGANCWAVYYRGRLLHGGLSSSGEAFVARGMYAEHIPASDYRWRLLTNPFKHESPSTDPSRAGGSGGPHE